MAKKKNKDRQSPKPAPPPATGREWIFRTVLIAGSLIFTVLALEVILRASPPAILKDIEEIRKIESKRKESAYIRSDDPVLIYERRPHYHFSDYYYTNGQGILRKKGPVPVNKPKGTFRILLLGDSIGSQFSSKTLKYGFAELLEKYLNRDRVFGDKKVELLNFSGDGYSALQEARLLELKAGKFEPDLVLWQYCMNDPGSSYMPAHLFLDPPSSFSYLQEFITRRFNQKYRYETAKAVSPTRGPDEPDKRIQQYWAFMYHPDHQPWKTVLQGYGKVRAYAKERSIPVVQLVIPLFPRATGNWRNPYADMIHEQLHKAGAGYGFYVCDVRDDFAAHTPAEIGEANPQDIYHPNEEGHRLIAEGLLAYFKEHVSVLGAGYKE